MTNCLLIGLFPVWKTIWKILTRPLFIASGVLFIYEDMPSAVQNILWWNPLLHASGVMRTGFYPTYDAAYVSYGYTYGLALGLIFIHKTHPPWQTRPSPQRKNPPQSRFRNPQRNLW